MLLVSEAAKRVSRNAPVVVLKTHWVPPFASRVQAVSPLEAIVTSVREEVAFFAPWLWDECQHEALASRSKRSDQVV